MRFRINSSQGGSGREQKLKHTSPLNSGKRSLSKSLDFQISSWMAPSLSIVVFFSRLSRLVGFDFSFWLLTTLIFSLYFQGNSCPKPKDYLQDNKKFHPTSCLDYLLKCASACRMNRLYDTSGNSFPAYCDFKSEPGFAWTLVMSWANKYRALSAFQSNTFKKNTPVNENSLIWNMYRLSLTRMRSLQAHSNRTVLAEYQLSFYTSTAARPAAISTRGPAQCQVKITLVIIESSTTSFVVQQGIFPPPSGGLVPTL